MHKSLFKADFQESTSIVVSKRLSLNKEGFDNMRFSRRLGAAFANIFIMIPLFYFIGIKMPPVIIEKKGSFSLSMAKYGVLLGPAIKLVLIIWFLLTILLLVVQRKNIGRYALDSYFVFLQMCISFLMIMFDLLLGVSVAGIGLVASIFLVAGGSIYIINTIYNIIFYLKFKMFGIKRKQIPFTWNIIVTVLILVLAIVSSMIWRPKELNILLYICSFGLLLILALVAFSSKIMIHYFFVDFYFAKYGEQYKKKFKITDEQWYGPRKAKRLAKKKGK
ncbi:hypothetical protein GNF18_07275 [Ligilactobacillus pobuzihii]|uniref:hypothetical protein n=1 Tax=Ligilactobacillus pobuzihii TaxID=449659 RepID=UPI0019CF8B9C|nr:hypothetical protein [Ligilactobacillus pobuzihii]MBN7274935.1 hypothetical protein [Ligilactobacillus pobuzihii]